MTALDTHPVAVKPGMGVTLFVSDAAEPVFGVVLDVYINAAGDEVAEVQLPGRPPQTATQNTRFLRPSGGTR